MRLALRIPDSGSIVIAEALASTPVGSGDWIIAAAPPVSGLGRQPEWVRRSVDQPELISRW